MQTLQQMHKGAGQQAACWRHEMRKYFVYF